MPGKQKKSANTATRPTRPEPTARPGTTSMGIPTWAPWAVVVFTALIYFRALDNGFTYIDDDYYVLKNYYLRDFSFHGIKAIFTHFYSFNYHPLTSISNLIEFRFWGLNPKPYHFFNVLLHLVNTWLVFRIAEQLSGKRVTAIVVCILFALHPMHVESVAWIAERKDVLYTAFYLAAILQYQRHATSGYQTKYYLVALLLFLCSLLSKSAAVTLPLLLVAIDIYKGRKIDAKAILEKVPFLALSVLFGILAIKSQQHGGALNDLSVYYSFFQRIFLLTAGLAAYFIKLVAPFGLSAIHYYPDLHGGPLPWYYYLSLPFVLSLVWLIVRKSAYRKEMIFGVSFFLIAISVMLQIVTVGAAIWSERYTYVSYIGLFYIAGQYISDKWESPSANVTIGVFSAFVLIFSIQTYSRIGVWQNSDVLFTDIVNKNVNNWRNCYVYYYWGLSKEGNTREAIDCYTKAIALKPDFDRAYNVRGLAYDGLGDHKTAIGDFNKAINLTPGKAELYNSRGWAYYQSGDKTQAMNDFEKAISMDPKYPEVYNNRGWAYYEANDLKSAMRDFDKAILLNEGFTKPYYNRAAIKVNAGDDKGAIADYDYLIKLNPDDATAYLNRGIAHFNLKDNLACPDWRRAADLGNKMAAQALYQNCR